MKSKGFAPFALVIIIAALALAAVGTALYFNPQKNKGTKTNINAVANTNSATPDSYLACGCGCCGGVTSQGHCLYYAKGDDLNKIISDDIKASQNANCAKTGCSAGIKYTYCDTKDANSNVNTNQNINQGLNANNSVNGDGSINTKAGCEALNGQWGRIGLSPTESCNLPTTDGGKSCRDSSDCEAKLCLAEVTNAEIERLQKGEEIEKSGKCPSHKIVVGCIQQVKNGKVNGPMLCID